MSTALSTNKLDELAAQVIAGVADEAGKIDTAAPFFSGLMEQVERKAPALRRYTAAEFFVRQEEKFRAVVGYLAEGRGQLWIADRVGCSHHTVRAVKERFPRAVAIEKERLADLCQSAGALLVERIIENPESLPPQSLGVTAGILMDKAAMLRGGPTLTIEHRHSFSHEDYLSLVKGAPIDVPSEARRMDFVGGKSGQMAPAEGADPAGLVESSPPAPGAPTDSRSLVLQREAATATHPATTDTPDPAHPGGEGVASRSAGGLEGDAL